MRTAEERNGVQSVRRALHVLRLLGQSNDGGLRFSDLGNATGLTRGTLHRLLHTMTRAGFVEQDRATRRYLVGAEFLAIGALRTNQFNLRDLARPSLVRLAKLTDDTVFLTLRSGLESVCLDRQEGGFPIKTMTLSIGGRRPLGVGAGSLAILSFLPERERRDIVSRNAARLKDYLAISPTALLEETRRARARGYAVNDGLVLRGMCAVGLPILNQQSQPIAALSVAAISERMASGRRADILKLLRAEALQIARAIRPDITLAETPPRVAARGWPGAGSAEH
jgi:DNA-binding IclR family transcriptional regulator